LGFVDFEVSERNKDASHASTAHKLILDALHDNHMAAVPALPSQNRLSKIKTKRGKEERERENKKKQGGRESRKGEEASANSPPEWPECSACI
jgi:hypothetical protein